MPVSVCRSAMKATGQLGTTASGNCLYSCAVRAPSQHSGPQLWSATVICPQSHLHHQQDTSQHCRCVTAHSHQRKRNPFLDIERDVLPDGKPNTPWRRLKLQIQQALSIQALFRIYTNNRHKNNVWRPMHSAGVIMRMAALQYYRILQNPVSDQQTSVQILELLHHLAPDLTDPKVLHVLDGARLSQVIVVLSTLNPRPEGAVVDPLVRELMREGGKKLPVTKPDLLAELAAALVRLGWWERELWLAVVAAAKGMLLVQQQQNLHTHDQHKQQSLADHLAQVGGTTAVAQQEQGQQQQLWGELLEQQLNVQARGKQHVQQQQQQQQRQWHDLVEDDYITWEEQQGVGWQLQQQQGAGEALPHWQQQQLQLPLSDQSWQEGQQLQQQQLGLASQTEFQWEEQQQSDEQQEWLEEQHWYGPGWQQQQSGDDDHLLRESSQQLTQVQQQQQLGLLQDDALYQQPLSSGGSGLLGPRWLSADFPKLAAALAAVAAREGSQGVCKDTVSNSSTSSSGLGIRDSVEEVMQTMGSAAARVLVLLTPAELADLAQAYATLGLCHDELLRGINRTLLENVNYMTSSFSSYQPSNQQQQFYDEAAGTESELAAVIRAASGLCELGYADLALAEAVQKLLVHCLRGNRRGSSITSDFDTGMGLGGTAAGVGAVQLVQLLQLLVSTVCSSNAAVEPLAKFVCSSLASSGLDALTPQQLQAAAASLVELQQQQDAAVAAAVIGAATAARAAECGPEVLSEVLWCCVNLGTYSELLAELAVASVEQGRQTLHRGSLRKQQQQQTKKGRGNSGKRRSATSSTAAAAAGSADALQVGMGFNGMLISQDGVVLSSKGQAQMIWALQRLDRQDLVDRALAALHPGGVAAPNDISSSTESTIPMF